MSSCRVNPFLLLISLFLQTVSGCLVVREKDPNPNIQNCNCNVKLFNQEDIRNNEGGRYLGDLQVWDPIVESKQDCWLAITCKPVPGVSSFFTVMFRSNGPPIYINRVVSNQSTFVEQPRSIGNLKCNEHNGEHQWFFHDALIQDFSLACVADSYSCDCPRILSDGRTGFESRNPSVTNQCDFFKGTCMQNTEIPFLHTTNTNPVNSGAGAGALGSEFDDLRCVKTGDEFSWYFANLKLQDVSMHCGTNTAVFGEETYLTCGVFQVINKLEDLKWYHQVGAYSTAQVGISSWTPAFEFEITCEDGFKPVVFSENNPPIEIPDSVPTIKCTYNPMANYLMVWIANGIRLITPAGACMKL
ncbi:CUB domain-containing protein [Caenorhabditis elegans]|uniref:CUB domain-containing protein n=1 Tax=Caenorhabditis elegans TaxID=6239 RepID=A4UVL6_CAEEL|nr:CUB domain-containing protein [Caenorhabditis elegans]CAM84818.1 CUB domain-containing protein [Caenorhabditis elegans]|eukprot:NP_001122935.1 Uncharacterized protein CELE_F28B1.9 [Caenorhabditis elegans]